MRAIPDKVASGTRRKIADYCKSDVINTYRLWLRHELFRGRLGPEPVRVQRVEHWRVSEL